MPSLVMKPYNKLTYAFLQNGYIDTESKFKVALNRMPISWTWLLDKYIHCVSCIPEDKEGCGGGGGVSKNHVKVKGGQQKSSMAYFTLHQPHLPDK